MPNILFLSRTQGAWADGQLALFDSHLQFISAEARQFCGAQVDY